MGWGGLRTASIAYLASVFLSFLILGGEAASLIAVTSILCGRFPKQKYTVLSVSSAVAVIAQIGVFSHTLSRISFMTADGEVYVGFARALFIAFVYGCVVVTTVFAFRYAKRFIITSLFAVQVLALTLLAQNIVPLLIQGVLKAYLSLLSIAFLAILMNTDLQKLSFREAGPSVLSFWSISTQFPLPFRLVKVHDLGAQFSDCEVRTRLYWRAFKILALNGMIAGVYNIGVQFLQSETFFFRKVEMQFVFRSAYTGYEILAEKYPGPLGHWLGMAFVGVGALIRISVGLNYSVAIASMCGFELATNTRSNAFHYRSYGEFLRGFYFYYSYLLRRIFFPRVENSLRWLTRSFTRKQASFVNVFATTLVAGFVFNIGRFAYPFYYSRGLKASAELLIGSLFYFIPAGLLLAYSHVKRSGYEQIEGVRLFLFRIWIFLTYSILITVKTSQRVPGWDLSKVFQNLKELFL